ncbi:hypothetical protein PFLUV_G00014040 [Perca fluviatilis]|uniref:Uncharacterized protein n=1 Tax=Perca fluviatilis TaxID=8168 RepID=A0A6A5FSK9_PERFL|nr:hypothetical protein PFLUV_G00014040 [Perca fluviatilis]
MDIVSRLQQEMKNRDIYDKVFSQIWGVAGGWAVVTCPCAVVYAAKFNIRAESPRDYTDILLSLKHFINVTLRFHPWFGNPPQPQSARNFLDAWWQVA